MYLDMITYQSYNEFSVFHVLTSTYFSTFLNEIV